MRGHLSRRVDELLDQLATNDGPGCAVGVVSHGELIYGRGIGQADLEHAAPITTGTPFHLASVSKHVTAFAVALLAGRQQLGLDDDVRRYIPELPDFRAPLTVRQLVHHTSGLRDQWQLLMLDGWRIDDVVTDGDVLDVLTRQRELNFPPGEQYSYSNSGYTLLGQIVDRVTGRSLRRFCHDELFAPLGMGHTHFHDDHTELVPGRAFSYKEAEGGGFRKAVMSFATVGATGLHSTVEDLARWVGNLGSGAVAGAAAAGQMLEQGRLLDGTTTGYAFGLIVDTQRGAARVHHAGEDAGYTSYVARFPEHDFAVIVLANGRNILAAPVGEHISGICLEDLGQLPHLHQEFVGLPPELAHRFAGIYLDPSTGLSVELVEKSGGLVRPLWGQELALEYTGDQEFRLPGHFRVQFSEHNGRATARAHSYGSSLFVLDRVRPTAPGADELSPLCGDYRSRELTVDYRVELREGQLWLHCPKFDPMPLQPTVAGTFSGTWGDSEIGWPFAVIFERLGRAPSSFLLSMDRSRHMPFYRLG